MKVLLHTSYYGNNGLADGLNTLAQLYKGLLENKWPEKLIGQKPSLITQEGKIIAIKRNSGRISEIWRAMDHPLKQLVQFETLDNTLIQKIIKEEDVQLVEIPNHLFNCEPLSLAIWEPKESWVMQTSAWEKHNLDSAEVTQEFIRNKTIIYLRDNLPIKESIKIIQQAKGYIGTDGNMLHLALTILPPHAIHLFAPEDKLSPNGKRARGFGVNLHSC
tara:strand:- start:174 stop:827 length:654 start_codon:yes stop_codon:yes gene_type:complete